MAAGPPVGPATMACRIREGSVHPGQMTWAPLDPFEYWDILPVYRGLGVGAVLRWWPPSTMWAGPFSIYGHHQGFLNNPIFSNLGLCAACWAIFMCHHKLWPTSVSHPFSSLNSSLSFAGGKNYQKITIPIFRLVLQHFAIPGCFPYILFYRYLFSLIFFWLVCYCSLCLYFSPGN